MNLGWWSTRTYELTLQVESSPSSSYDYSCQKGKAEQEICQAQAQTTSLHVLHVWYMSSQTMVFKGLKRFDQEDNRWCTRQVCEYGSNCFYPTRINTSKAGFLTNLLIWGATIFVDHFSDYIFIALMRDLTLDEMLLAKSSFERHANKGGVSIISYRADN